MLVEADDEAGEWLVVATAELDVALVADGGAEPSGDLLAAVALALRLPAHPAIVPCAATPRHRSTLLVVPTSRVTIHTDGACLGNPGPGGWGAVLRYGEHEPGACTAGTRRRPTTGWSLMAAIVALETLTRPAEVDLHTDSKLTSATGSWRGWRSGRPTAGARRPRPR
ncbi:RNase H family protein [Nocardioides convexus]|uniref:RNase H family protein n=1 Tax=Nocardioides convexus TaxID=2712224 RepID=UPI002418B815|nr:RNase H family protein [Nocardioides convexus]